MNKFLAKLNYVDRDIMSIDKLSSRPLFTDSLAYRNCLKQVESAYQDNLCLPSYDMKIFKNDQGSKIEITVNINNTPINPMFIAYSFSKDVMWMFEDSIGLPTNWTLERTDIKGRLWYV